MHIISFLNAKIKSSISNGKKMSYNIIYILEDQDISASHNHNHDHKDEDITGNRRIDNEIVRELVDCGGSDLGFCDMNSRYPG